MQLTPLTHEPIALAVPVDHSVAEHASVELQDHTLVDLPSGWGTRMAIDRSFAATGVRPTVAYGLNDAASMIEFIRHGLAIGMLPPSFVEEVDGLATIPIRCHVPQVRVAIATPTPRRLSAAAQVPLQAIERRAG